MTDADDYVWIDDFRLMGTPIGLTDTTPPNITLTQPLS